MKTLRLRHGLGLGTIALSVALLQACGGGSGASSSSNSGTASLAGTVTGFGSVVVDGFTGDLHVMSFYPEDKRWVHVGTRPLDPRSDPAWLDAVDTQDTLRLSIEGGALKVEPVARR